MSLFSDVFPLPIHFEFFAIFSNCLHFSKFVCLLKRLQRLKQEWQKSPTGTRQTYDLEKYCRKKISQIIKDYFYLPFFLLIILCPRLTIPSGSLWFFEMSSLIFLNVDFDFPKMSALFEAFRQKYLFTVQCTYISSCRFFACALRNNISV